ncbi:FAD-dependent oxidoreductase [Enhygromyxa salina]|uniref:Flavin containing amine oxidoreductase n=1 Tax=Enhygromyxa salina TaxID=215803 RepID=A0A2S9YDP9_9BACT|nr:FAD-dependent oxidoreductase [Enhygromyxa salina]PRQ03233.1 Flavin containing amine oxidoreductase [Enhygromyxa salina]
MGLSRRELLRTSGLGALALGCNRDDKPSSAAPRFTGQSPERGHLLRSAALLDAPIDAHIRAGVVIVGGGAAGFSAAWRLQKLGLDDFIVLELEPEIGGTARSGVLPRSPHPMGAHYLPAPPRECSELLELLTDLDLLVGYEHDGTPEYRSTAICAAPEERHFHAGTWHPGLYPSDGQTPAQEQQWERFWDQLRELDRVRDHDGELLFRLPVRRSSARLRGLDQLSMAAWLDEHGFDSWRLRWYVDYACRDDYGCTLAQTSAFAGLHHFLARGLEDTREDPLLTWPGGNGELIASLRARVDLGARLKTDHIVYAIDPERGQLRVRDLASERSISIEAQAILWAAPRFLLRHVLPRDRDPLSADALTYAPWLVANLELREPPGGVGATLAWDNVPIIENPAARNLGYVVATHQEGRDRAIEGGAVITYYQPLVADDPAGLAQHRAHLLGSDARGLSEQVLGALEHMHPGIRRHLSALHVHRWGHAMIRPVPGHLFGGALELARAPIGCVRACATDVGGLPLFEEAFYAAIDAADWALDRIGRA